MPIDKIGTMQLSYPCNEGEVWNINSGTDDTNSDVSRLCKKIWKDDRECKRTGMIILDECNRGECARENFYNILDIAIENDLINLDEWELSEFCFAGDDNYFLHRAILHEKIEIVEGFIGRCRGVSIGAGINLEVLGERYMGAEFKKDSVYSCTPLGVAIYKKNLDLVKICAEHPDIKLTSQNKHYNNTYLHMAAAAGDKEIFKYLNEKMPDDMINKKNGVECEGKFAGGNTPLHVAAVKGSVGLFPLLLENGANIKIQNTKGNSFLHMLSSSYRPEITSMILDEVLKDVDVNLKNCEGCSPLHIAAANRNMVIFEWLISKGGDANLKNKNGETPKRLFDCSPKIVNRKSIRIK